MLRKILKITAAILSAAVLLAEPVYCTGENTEPKVSASSAIIICADNGEIIYEKDAYTERSMASTTKIMTALLAIENYDLSRIVTVSGKAVGVEGSTVYLYENEKLTMENLVYALMLESANDAATAIAIEISGSVKAFSELMNRKAEEIGLEDTSFANPHGLDAENHYTTAYDLAVLTAYALKNEDFREIVSTYRRVVPLENGEGSRLLLNHNKLLRLYDGAIGVKTGYTKKSGRCLVSAAERNGITFIAVTLNDPDDWDDHTEMLDYGFSLYECPLKIEAGTLEYYVPVVNGTYDYVSCVNVKGITLIVPRGTASDLRQVIELNSFYYAPISQGDILGRVAWYSGGEEVTSVELAAVSDVRSRKTKLNFWQWLLSLFGLLDD